MRAKSSKQRCPALCFEHVQNIRDGLPHQVEWNTNVTNALRISPNALRITIRTTFGLIRAQCDWGIMNCQTTATADF